MNSRTALGTLVNQTCNVVIYCYCVHQFHETFVYISKCFVLTSVFKDKNSIVGRFYRPLYRVIRNDCRGFKNLSVWNELDYRVDVCKITKDAHIEHL